MYAYPCRDHSLWRSDGAQYCFQWRQEARKWSYLLIKTIFCCPASLQNCPFDVRQVPSRFTDCPAGLQISRQGVQQLYTTVQPMSSRFTDVRQTYSWWRNLVIRVVIQCRRSLDLNNFKTTDLGVSIINIIEAVDKYSAPVSCPPFVVKSHIVLPISNDGLAAETTSCCLS